MALDRLGYDLMQEETISAEKILSELLSDKNIDMKTHVLSPVEFAMFESVIEYVDDLLIFSQKNGLKRTTKLLKTMSKKLKMFLVSWNRLSRTEITNTLAGRIHEEQANRTLTQRLLGISGEK